MEWPLTNEQINELLPRILGRNVDLGVGWTTTGAANNRNQLDQTIRDQVPNPAVTRILNSFFNELNFTGTATNAFDNRFSKVVGDEMVVDKDRFESLGGNIINVIYQLKNKIEELECDPTGTEFIPTPEQQQVLESGITSVILQDILNRLNGMFQPTQVQLSAMNSGINSVNLSRILSDIEYLRLNMGSGGDGLTLTDVQIAAVNSGITSTILNTIVENVQYLMEKEPPEPIQIGPIPRETLITTFNDVFRD